MSGRRNGSVVGETSGLALGAEPRVELMPPEVAKRAKARSARNLGVLVLIVAVIAVGGGYMLATLANTNAQASLAAARADTARILAEQQEYSSVTVVAGLIAGIEETETLGKATEVSWTAIAREIFGALPPTTKVSDLNIEGRAPWMEALSTTGPLRMPQTATLTLTVVASSFPDIAATLRAIK